MEYEITIKWICGNEHENTAIVTMHEENDNTTVDDIDKMIEQLVADVSFIRDNSCTICQDETQMEVDWCIHLVEKVENKESDCE